LQPLQFAKPPAQVNLQHCHMSYGGFAANAGADTSGWCCRSCCAGWVAAPRWTSRKRSLHLKSMHIYMKMYRCLCMGLLQNANPYRCPCRSDGSAQMKGQSCFAGLAKHHRSVDQIRGPNQPSSGGRCGREHRQCVNGPEELVDWSAGVLWRVSVYA